MSCDLELTKLFIESSEQGSYGIGAPVQVNASGEYGVIIDKRYIIGDPTPFYIKVKINDTSEEEDYTPSDITLLPGGTNIPIVSPGSNATTAAKLGPRSDVQSVLFSRSKWSPSEAKAWLAKNEFKHGDIEEKEETLRFRQHDPHGKTFRSEAIGDGITFVYEIKPKKEAAVKRSSCDECGDKYSDELVYYNGKFLCPNCLYITKIWDKEGKLVVTGHTPHDMVRSMAEIEKIAEIIPFVDYKGYMIITRTYKDIDVHYFVIRKPNGTIIVPEKTISTIDQAKSYIDELVKEAGFHGFPVDEPIGRKQRDLRDQEGGYYYSHEAGDPGTGNSNLSEGPEAKGRAQRDDNAERRFVQLGLPDSRTLNYDKRDDKERRSQSEGFYSKGGSMVKDIDRRLNESESDHIVRLLAIARNKDVTGSKNILKKAGDDMDKQDIGILTSVIRKDAELFRSVLITAYQRLDNAFNGDQVAIAEKLHSLFPDDKAAVDSFLADSGKNNELIRKVVTDPTEQIKNVAAKVEKLGYKKLAEQLLKSIKE